MSKELVTLESQELGKVQYALDHAKRLIKLESKLGKVNWVPAKGSPYEIIDGSLNKRTSSDASKES